MTFRLLTLQIRLAADAAYVRQTAREVAELLGFDRNDQTRIATAVSEIARNAFQYAGSGTVELSLAPGAPQSFQIKIHDPGPGIRDVEAVLAGRCENSVGGGRSIFGARCVMDDFAITTVPGAGTTVTMAKHLASNLPHLDHQKLAAISQELAQRPAHSPLEELHRQNQELLGTLHQIQEQQTDWERLYREMETTNQDMLAVHDALSDQNQALSQSEARFRLMVDEVKDYAIFLLNPDGSVTTWNSGAQRILGYTEKEIVGRPGHLVFLPEDQERGKSSTEMQTARETGRAEDEHWHLRRDGSRFWGNSILTALWNEDTLIGYVKILQDTTERKRSQDALQAAYQRERHITEVLQSPLIRATPEDTVPGFSVVTFYESALDEAEVGGDFFDAFRLPSGMAVLLIGDASGKGLGAALRAMQVKELVPAFLHVHNQSAAEVVTQLNEYLCGAYDRSPEEAFGFVTLSLVVLDPQTGRGESISAGCEPALLLKANGKAETLHASGLPFGVDARAHYEAVPFQLSSGDTLVLVTDGITEARCGKEFLNYEGMVVLSQQNASAQSLREMGRGILEGARAFAQGRFRDDVCLLLARRL